MGEGVNNEKGRLNRTDRNELPSSVRCRDNYKVAGGTKHFHIWPTETSLRKTLNFCRHQRQASFGSLPYALISLSRERNTKGSSRLQTFKYIVRLALGECTLRKMALYVQHLSLSQVPQWIISDLVITSLYVTTSVV